MHHLAKKTVKHTTDLPNAICNVIQRNVWQGLCSIFQNRNNPLMMYYVLIHHMVFECLPTWELLDNTCLTDLFVKGIYTLRYLPSMFVSLGKSEVQREVPVRRLETGSIPLLTCVFLNERSKKWLMESSVSR